MRATGTEVSFLLRLLAALGPGGVGGNLQIWWEKHDICPIKPDGFKGYPKDNSHHLLSTYQVLSSTYIICHPHSNSAGQISLSHFVKEGHELSEAK